VIVAANVGSVVESCWLHVCVKEMRGHQLVGHAEPKDKKKGVEKQEPKKEKFWSSPMAE
jgi:hypothetical protein